MNVIELLKPNKEKQVQHKPLEEKPQVVSVRENNNDTDSTKKDNKQQSVDRYVRHMQTHEASRLHGIESSRKVAWRVAAGACLITALSWIALVLMLPLRHIETHVIRVDNSTGAVDIVTPSSEAFISNSDALDNYWLGKFLTSYESYNYYTIQADYDTVGALSTPVVAAEYAQIWEDPEALHVKHKDAVEVRIEIISMIPTGNDIRTIRFKKHTENFRNRSQNKEENFVASISFEYKKTLEMTGAQRLVNPIGFFVRSYRRDKEIN